MKRTVSDFLKSEAAERALTSGNTQPSDYLADDYGRVGLSFGGHYTLPEVDALRADLIAMQAACDAWRGVTRNEWGEIMAIADRGPPHRCTSVECCEPEGY